MGVFVCKGTVCVNQNEDQNTLLIPRESLFVQKDIWETQAIWCYSYFTPPYNLLFQPSNFSQIVSLDLTCCILVSISIVTEHNYVVIQ